MGLEIIRKSTMPDGTEIQFEKWDVMDYCIGAYPIAKATGKYGLVRRNERFRLTIARFENLEEAAGIFDGLREGVIKLEDEVLYPHYWYGQKEKYYLGLSDNEGY